MEENLRQAKNFQNWRDLKVYWVRVNDVGYPLSVPDPLEEDYHQAVNMNGTEINLDIYHPRDYGWVPENEFQQVCYFFLNLNILEIC